MPRLAPVLGILLLLGFTGCDEGAGPELLPPYDGPLEAGPTEWTGYQPGSVDINDLVGGGSFGLPGVIPGVHTYQVVLASGIDWNTADALAKQTMKNGVAGPLATIASPEENAAIEALRSAVTIGQLWLGGFQPPGSPEPGGGWTWLNSEGTFPGTNGGPAYASWATGEPNDGGNEPYLTIGRFNDGRWNDQGGTCDGYVIEWDQ